jgi:hypothetical protein
LIGKEVLGHRACSLEGRELEIVLTRSPMRNRSIEDTADTIRLGLSSAL